MARTLNTSGDYYSYLSCVLAVEDDGSAIKLWVPGESPRTVGSGLTNPSSLVTIGSATTWNSLPGDVYPMVMPNAVTAGIGVDTPIATGSTEQAYYAAYKSFTDTINHGTIVGESYSKFFGIEGTTDHSCIGITSIQTNGQGTTSVSGAFGIGYKHKASTYTGSFYGAEASAGAIEAYVTSGVNSAYFGHFSSFFNSDEDIAGTGFRRQVVGSPLIVIVFDGFEPSEADFQAIHSDPFGAVFDSGGTSVAPLAMGSFMRMRNG